MNTNLHSEENERLVRAFYEATVPGHRESLRGIQAPEVVYDLPKRNAGRLRSFRGSPGCTRAFSH
jgi:hypothetical protein